MSNPTTAPLAEAPAAGAEGVPSAVEPKVAARLDGFVERAPTAARAFRELVQEAGDRIVWAMVVAGRKGVVEFATLRCTASPPLCLGRTSRGQERSRL
jgi:peptide subunit release factor 1 (eRF1)